MDYIVYGAGFFGLHLTELLLTVGVHPRCLFDREKVKQGRCWQGIPVYAPDVPLAKGARVIVAHASQEVCASIGTDLEGKGFRHVETIYAFANRPENEGIFYRQILPIRVATDEMQREKERISTVEHLFADEISKELYWSIICALESKSFTGIHALPIEEQYLLHGIDYRADEVFCDIGAGPSAEFLQTVLRTGLDFYKFYLFDPCLTIVQTLNHIQDERIVYVKNAIGAHHGKVRVRNYWDVNAHIVSDAMQGDLEAACMPLQENDFSRQPTFVKIDVEGWEWNVLQGMMDMVQSERPVLAIACYHKVSDFWNMPLYFAKIPRVQMFLRSYLGVHESVLYVVPEERLL